MYSIKDVMIYNHVVVIAPNQANGKISVRMNYRCWNFSFILNLANVFRKIIIMIGFFG